MQENEVKENQYSTQQYVVDAIRSETADYPGIADNLTAADARFLHAAMGISTEAGELLDVAKKYIYYSKPVDIANVIEEIGDMFWYTAILCDMLGYDFEEIMAKNINKLRVRYPEKFTENLANNRDLEKERDVLEA